MNQLYPLKFEPQFIPKVWGGQKLNTLLGKDLGEISNCGESWEISGVEGNISVVSNGILAGNNLQELIEIYMGDLVGEKIFDQFGIEFPLLIKFLDASADLSVQVHPNDKLAKERHNAFGKFEMWYIIQADEGAMLNPGFLQGVDKVKYLESIDNNTVTDLLSFEETSKGEVFFIPAGRIHAIGKGIVVAEIQQTSDVTYRIFDYDRKDVNGQLRELHTDLALDAIDFSKVDKFKIDYSIEKNELAELVDCKYFTTSILEFNTEQKRDIFHLDSFIIYVCLCGSFSVEYEDGSTLVKKGETLLIPSSLSSYRMIPRQKESIKILEIYIK